MFARNAKYKTLVKLSKIYLSKGKKAIEIFRDYALFANKIKTVGHKQHLIKFDKKISHNNYPILFLKITLKIIMHYGQIGNRGFQIDLSTLKHLN